MRRVLLDCGHVMCVAWISARVGVEVRCAFCNCSQSREERPFEPIGRPIVEVLPE